MANIEYGNPFHGLVAGQTQGLANTRTAQEIRNENLNYDFLKWYQPLKQAQAQAGVGGDILKRLNEVMHYTGDPTAVNTALLHYFGVPPEALPQSYNSKHIVPGQQTAADLAFGAVPIPLSYQGVTGAGGVWQAGPPQQQGTGDPEYDALMNAYRKKVVKVATDNLDNQPNANVPHLNPLGQETAQPLSTKAGNNITVADGSMESPPPRNPAPYAVAPPPKQPANSIWDGEYQPPGATDGSP